MARRRRNPALVIAGNPPGKMSGEVHYIGYRHSDDGQNYEHEFQPGVELHATKDGAVTLLNPDREIHDDFGGQRFLVNPPRRKKSMARRLPPRHRSGPKKGQFKKRARSSSRRRRRNPSYATASRRPPARRRRPASRARVSRPAPRRRSPARSRAMRRRNPARKITVRRVLRDLQTGVGNAAFILVGKAGARTVHTLTGLPRAGNMGLAVQALSAVAVGMIADAIVGPARAKFVLAGGLTAPLETAIVAYNVPFLAPALSPSAAGADLGAYRSMGSYVRPFRAVASNGVGRYVARGAGLSGYVDPSSALEVHGGGYDYAGVGG